MEDLRIDAKFTGSFMGLGNRDMSGIMTEILKMQRDLALRYTHGVMTIEVDAPLCGEYSLTVYGYAYQNAFDYEHGDNVRDFNSVSERKVVRYV